MSLVHFKKEEDILGGTHKQRRKRRGQQTSNKISRAVVAQSRQAPATSERVEQSALEPRPRTSFTNPWATADKPRDRTP